MPRRIDQHCPLTPHFALHIVAIMIHCVVEEEEIWLVYLIELVQKCLVEGGEEASHRVLSLVALGGVRDPESARHSDCLEDVGAVHCERVQSGNHPDTDEMLLP